MKTRHKARELAVQTLYAMDFNNEMDKDHIPMGFSGTTEAEFADLEEEVKLYGSYLVKGTIENLDQINDLITRFSLNRPLNRIDIVDRNILRMSVFSLLYGDIHPHIVIDEAVKLSQDLSTEVNYKFINGMLDTMQKQLFPIEGSTKHDSTEDSSAN
ncbi:MAG: transcription antitermination factor NusB [Sphaerochaeta sp.]|nr:transcription antitermination factor NusB [Sphaerochaeta sp.]